MNINNDGYKNLVMDEEEIRELAKRAQSVLYPLAPRLRECDAQLFIRLADGREVEVRFSEG